MVFPEAVLNLFMTVTAKVQFYSDVSPAYPCFAQLLVCL